MTIGRLAKLAGINVETIRYYQRRGLIDEPRKPLGGHRRYPPDAIKQLAFIRRAQQLGFSLEEVKSLQALADGKHARETREIGEKKLAVLESRMTQLNAMRRELGKLVEASRRSRDKSDPFIKALYADDEPV